MREYDDISLEELERIASDESVEVPESLDTEIRTSIALLELQEESKEETLTLQSTQLRRRIHKGRNLLGGFIPTAFEEPSG